MFKLKCISEKMDILFKRVKEMIHTTTDKERIKNGKRRISWTY